MNSATDNRQKQPLPPIDPALAHTLQRFARLDADTPTPQLDYAERRRLLSELQAGLIRSALPGISRAEHFLAAGGREICMRSYRRPGSGSGRTLVWLHGGGWMVGDLNTHDDLCEHLAQFTGHVVLSVHYRRAPESPFPAALDDVMAVLQWLGDMRGLRPFAAEQILLGGDSAGAHLALAAAVRRIQHPADAARIAGLLLLYPPLRPGQDNDSMRRFATGFGLTPDAMQRYWQALGQPEGEAAQWLTPGGNRAAIAHLPPTLLMTASHDILRDEAEDFAHEAQALGAPLQLLQAPAMVHGFARMLAASPAARQQVELACSSWAELMARQRPQSK
ncbi:MAG: alpha/beta hydrolase [Comamonas sp.]|jgi:acetyl esterase|uniref:alpha/beta hydrolase fold domain-containing protein n=1 Tax=Comamonas sp. TaxID=34028 RepID=UPI0028428874|nr:alpha/beta hydrolase fold domain-containing protein [Comamonas sp.]MDR3066882.1 alpha/beta hydrolase [Comamonas sp.]